MPSRRTPDHQQTHRYPGVNIGGQKKLAYFKVQCYDFEESVCPLTVTPIQNIYNACTMKCSQNYFEKKHFTMAQVKRQIVRAKVKEPVKEPETPHKKSVH